MEWQNVSTHLKELNDSHVATSQTCIDWSSSEDEKDTIPKRKKLSFILQGKSTHTSSFEFLSKSKADDHSVYEEHQNSIDNAKEVNDEAQSPIFKLKVPKHSSVRLPIDFKNSLFTKGTTSNETNSPLIITHFNPKSMNIVDEKTEADEVFPKGSSPILNSRMKPKNVRNESERNFPRASCEIVIKPQGEKNIPAAPASSFYKRVQNSVLNECSKETENCASHISEQSGDVDKSEIYPTPTYKFNLTSQNLAGQHNLQLKEFDLVITECSSPTNNQIKELNSSTSPSIESKESDSIFEALTKQKGSEWVKDVQYKTPEKVFYPSETNISSLQVPDSSRKKIKRNGLADQLRKYVQSWHSSFFMWDHQMTEVTKPCCSPTLCHLDSRKSPLNLSSHCLDGPETKTTGTATDTKMEWPSNLAVKDINASQKCIFHKEKVCPSPKLACFSESPDSLEIGSFSESSLSGLTPQNKLAIPKRHMCVEVIKIEWQTAMMVTALCREVDYCSEKTREKSYRVIPKILLGIFGYLDFKSLTRLEDGDKIKIFAPWQVLEVKTLGYPVLFSSHFVSSKRKKVGVDSKLNKVKMTKLASWKCSCTTNSIVLPFCCHGGKLQIHASNIGLFAQSSKQMSPTCTRFRAVKDSPDISLPKDNRYWTVLEAVETSGGKFDTPVSVTLKVWRIFPRRKSDADNEPSFFLVLGQDPSGVFLLVEVPNRPQIVTLSSLLREGVGTTHTLTHLSVVQRITDTQYPLLFSLIHSLESLHKQCISNNPRLLPHLKEQLQKRPHSFCYKFSVLLGVTSDILVTGSEDRSLTLPHWDIEEALKQDTGTRGCVSANVLYYVQPHLYVTCRRQEKFVRLHKLIVKDGVWFPSWMKCDGTIMTTCVLQDIAVWHGYLIVDEFSHVQRIKSELPVFIEDIVGLVSEIGTNSAVHELVSVKGFVKDVNEEEASSWDECNICGASDLYRITSDNIKCQKCKTEKISTITKYSLEIILHFTSINNVSLHLRTKLFQTTIKKLLKGIQSQSNQYKMDDLLGRAVGPLICVIKALKEDCSVKTFMLVELPY